MTDYVDVTPTVPQRVAFAVAAVAADPYTRTVGTGVFRVRQDVFTHLPEEVLVGSLVGGSPYRAVADDEPVTPVIEDPLEGEQHPTISGLHLCQDCDKVAASAAGLAAHRRAKHEGE